MQPWRLLMLLVIVLTCGGACGAFAAKPNIVFFLTDDQGYGDVGCYGSKIETPNIDRPRARGMKFTDFCVHQRCSPTRLAFLTGSHAHRVGCTKVIYRRDRMGIWCTRRSPARRSWKSLPIRSSPMTMPLLAWCPGRIQPRVSDELFCLVDVLPTIASIADVKLNRKVDGMDLSHMLLGGKGKSREYILMSFGRGFYVRDKRFRLHQDGTLYDIPITSDSTRYSEKKVAPGDLTSDRERLQSLLTPFMSIESEFEKTGSSDKNRKKKSKKDKA